MFAKIKVSYNPLIAHSSWMPAALRENLVLPMLDIRDTAPRTGKTFTVTGFWVNREKWVGYPLFYKNGHKARRLSREEYLALVDSATIVIDPFCSKPENFDELVASLEDEIRAYLRKHGVAE